MFGVLSVVFLVGIQASPNVGEQCVVEYTSAQGVCIPPSKCRLVKDVYQYNGALPTFCSVLVCCSDSSHIVDSVPSDRRPVWGSYKNNNVNSISNTNANNNPNLHADNDSNTKLNSNTDSNTNLNNNTNKNPNLNNNTNSNINLNTNTNSNSNLNNNTDSNTNLNNNIDSSTNLNTSTNSNVNLNTNTNSNTNLNSNTNSNLNLNSNTNSNTNLNSNTNSNSNLNNNTDSNTNLNNNIDSSTNLNTSTNSNVNLNTNTNSNTNLNSNTNSNLNHNSNTNSNSNLNNNVDNNTNLNSNTNSNLNLNSNTNSNSNLNNNIDSNTNLNSNTNSNLNLNSSTNSNPKLNSNTNRSPNLNTNTNSNSNLNNNIDSNTNLNTNTNSNLNLNTNTNNNSTNNFNSSDSINENSNNNLRISERKCAEYTNAVTLTEYGITLDTYPEKTTLSAPKCNYERVELIVGGENAEQGEFPHMAAIGWVDVLGNYVFHCGGSLISSRFVLSAGHCASTPNKQLRYSQPKIVRLGEQNLNPTVDDKASPIDVPVKTIHKHPEYAPPGKYNDIALFELNADVDFETDIRPACLWTKPDFPGYSKAIATGWGVVDPRQPTKTSEELKKVSLTLMESDYCNNTLKPTFNRHWAGFSDGQLCAGDLRGGKDTCQGDSGSPLQVASLSNRCMFHIVGVTSFGRACAKSNTPAVYTRVSSYLDWIEGIVWPGE